MLTAVENTDKAKAEMAALKKQIKSWQRSGMSADEIWDAITAALDTDYPTLARMEEGRIKGDPIPMAGGVDFSLPRFKAELLGGAIETELYRPEENAQDLETYNPYRRRGGAFAELVSAWADIGADGAITPEILEAHREEILSAKDGSKTYEKIQSAIKTSEKASAELAALNEQITRLEQRGKQADEIWKRISNDFATNYPTLNKMEEKRRAGTALTTAGGVDFSMSELKRRVYGEPEPETATAAEDAWATDTEEAAPAEANAEEAEAIVHEPATEEVNAPAEQTEDNATPAGDNPVNVNDLAANAKTVENTKSETSTTTARTTSRKPAGSKTWQVIKWTVIILVILAVTVLLTFIILAPGLTTALAWATLYQCEFFLIDLYGLFFVYLQLQS